MASLWVAYRPHLDDDSKFGFPPRSTSQPHITLWGT
uniref:Uncharacterized protein n=1 Tax=Nelumbo nucifera TaxID=4432 RepID=A0A823A1V9_NELNU|nr:TPA_asm: hypothetical protein HUJ06_018065 [Nelumbo nucifera]